MKLLVVPLVALALAGAGLSGAVLTGQLPLLRNASEPEPTGPVGWDVLETWTGDVGPDTTTGTLDLRLFRGNVQVLGWSEPAYEVTLYEARRSGTGGGQHLGDAAVVPQFDAQEGDDGLALSLIVAPQGTVGIDLNQYADYAVIAKVPSSLEWSTAFVCSGAGPGQFEAVFSGLLDTLFSEKREGEESCTPGDSALEMSLGNIHLMDEEQQETEDIPFAFENLRGGELVAMAQYADVLFTDLSFAKAAVVTHYGNLQGNLEATELHAMSHYGDLTLSVVADTLSAVTHYGDAWIQVTGGHSGTIDVVSNYGDVEIGVPFGEDRGYDATGTTEYGEVIIALSGAEEEEDDDGALTTRAAAFPIPLPFGGGSRESPEGDTVHVTTGAYDSMPIQVVLNAVTQYGDVLITDEELEEEDEDEDTEA